ncbi:MAG: hypothetical protein IKW39_04900 [Alphaproteobacteria bacterium]|nr:hypothetical protein [Alphaproteobacteria bacterium]
MKNYLNNKVITFEVTVDETVRFQSRNQDKTLVSDKELFFIGNNYFYYVFNRNGKNSTYSLSEISEKEYFARKDDIFRQRPNGKFGTFQKGEIEYFIGCFKKKKWEKRMPVTDCILKEDSPLKKEYDKFVGDLASEENVRKKDKAFSEYQYANRCGELERKLGVSYVNVMRIGVDEKQLLEFKTSYDEAIKKLRFMSFSQLKVLQHEIFGNSRRKRFEAMTNLGIKFFDADVMIMDLSALDAVINQPLKDYAEKSIKIAIDSAIEMPYEERLIVYNSLLNANSSTKRKILSRLGVEADAIDLKVYPLAQIKRAIQNSLGLDNY